MSTAQLVIICVTVLLIVAFVIHRPQRAPRAPGDLAPAVGTSVAAHLGEQSIRGVVTAITVHDVVLSEASVIVAGEETKLGGTTRLPRRSVTFWQEM